MALISLTTARSFGFASLLASVTAGVALAGSSLNPADLTAESQAAGLTAADWAQIQELKETQKHALQAMPSGHWAFNPGLQMEAVFNGRSALIEPREGAWQFGLALRAYGFEGS